MAVAGNLGQGETGADGEDEAHREETLGGEATFEEYNAGHCTYRSEYEGYPGHVKERLTVGMVDDRV